MTKNDRLAALLEEIADELDKGSGADIFWLKHQGTTLRAAAALLTDRTALLNPYVVLLMDPETPLDVFTFTCEAENDEHAEEQAQDAYPTAEVLWVELGSDIELVYEHYWSN